MSFDPLQKPVQFLKRVGPARAQALGRMGIVTARDLLHHVPRRYDDASTIQPIASLQVGMDATAVGRVRSKGVIPTRSGLRIFQAVLRDDSGSITCAWPGQPWLERRIREGDLLLVTGPVKFFHGRQLQPREFTLLSRGGASHPSERPGPPGRPPPGRRGQVRSPASPGGEASASGEEEGNGPPRGTIFVVYPASDDVPQWVLRGLFDSNLDRLLEQVEHEEYMDAHQLEAVGVPPLREAFRILHRPRSLGEVEEGRRRLAWDELFFLQLVQAMARHRATEAEPGIVFRRTNRLVRPLHDALPFRLTRAQTRALREIYADMTSPRRMNRLLQGDVGSGKTVVALFAMLLAVETGHQAALMVPTELLAEQHAQRIGELVAAVGMEVHLLTGRLPAARRRRTLAAVRSGEASLVVGTHALFQDEVDFGSLGLVVVDEQHRFGVRQRMALGERGTRPDVLVMSATPIPRSLAMTLYGDLDLSVLDERPPGRKPVKTRLCPPSRRDEVYGLVARELDAGRQAYIVYPLVEDSEKLDLRSATAEHRRLSKEVFPDRQVALLHGQLSSDEQEAVMRSFLAGDMDVLVATTVVEVGIDVSNATVMVVEHAERFGLSQLHQLRGRVGRGASESWCILVAEPGDLARERLGVFRKTHDGFELAQADLRIRGQGDLFGSQQHGRDVELRHADLLRDEDLLAAAQARARAMVAADPELTSPEHERIRALLGARHAERLKLFQVG